MVYWNIRFKQAHHNTICIYMYLYKYEQTECAGLSYFQWFMSPFLHKPPSPLNDIWLRIKCIFVYPHTRFQSWGDFKKTTVSICANILLLLLNVGTYLYIYTRLLNFCYFSKHHHVAAVNFQWSSVISLLCKQRTKTKSSLHLYTLSR